MVGLGTFFSWRTSMQGLAEALLLHWETLAAGRLHLGTRPVQETRARNDACAPVSPGLLGPLTVDAVGAHIPRFQSQPKGYWHQTAQLPRCYDWWRYSADHHAYLLVDKDSCYSDLQRRRPRCSMGCDFLYAAMVMCACRPGPCNGTTSVNVCIPGRRHWGCDSGRRNTASPTNPPLPMSRSSSQLCDTSFAFSSCPTPRCVKHPKGTWVWTAPPIYTYQGLA